MKWHKQLFRHDPEKGIYGDCHRTAIACLLDLQPEDVPNFGEGGPDTFAERVTAWLASRGLVELSFPFYAGDEADKALTVCLQNMKVCNPGLLYLLGGKSRNGCGHTVICRDDEIVHDPSLDDSGIVGPMKDGFYWVSFIVAIPTVQP